MPDTQLNWLKCQGEVWCKLSTVNLNHPHFTGMTGVYVIWHGGTTPATLYVGQGNIRDSLLQRRADPRLQPYTNLGVYVTWAQVPAESLNGVERYLVAALGPKITGPVQQVPPISVNRPW
jgi:hypothetical protein